VSLRGLIRRAYNSLKGSGTEAPVDAEVEVGLREVDARPSSFPAPLLAEGQHPSRVTRHGSGY
jgi:hypothetical protein